MTEPTPLSQLRHLYQNMVNGAVRDTASARRIAEGLLAPAIEALERGTPPAVAVEPQPSPEGPPEVWLQLHGDCADHELAEPVDYTAGDVTWCWHSIHDSDVRYVRADLAPQPTQAQAGAVPQCWCLTCRPMRLEDPYSIRMALCPTCGNKRCPKANDHRNECTGSNEPGQPGSAYSGSIKGGQHGTE